MDEHRSERGLIEYGLGDWCQSARARVDHPKASNIFTSTVIGVDICRKAAKIFNAIEMYRQKVFAESLAEELRGAIRKHLIDFGDMCAVDRCQTAQAMAIYYGIFDLAEKKQAFALLLKLIEENDSHFDCGILGMRVLFHVLSEFGHSELAYRMITRDDFPSYGYWIQNGATSLWELFSPIERAQSSCNHHFFGDILSWFIKTLAGIQLNPFDENVNQVRIVPQFIESLNYVEAFMEAPAGRIHVFWERIEENIMMTVTIPQGIDAELVLKNGWHFEDGLTCKQLTGKEMVRLLPLEQPDILRRFA